MMEKRNQTKKEKIIISKDFLHNSCVMFFSQSCNFNSQKKRNSFIIRINVSNIYRSSRSQMFFKIGVLKDFTDFTEKLLPVVETF